MGEGCCGPTRKSLSSAFLGKSRRHFKVNGRRRRRRFAFVFRSFFFAFFFYRVFFLLPSFTRISCCFRVADGVSLFDGTGYRVFTEFPIFVFRRLPSFTDFRWFFFLRPVPVYFWRLTSLVEFPRGPRFSSFFISFFLIGSHGMGGAYRSSASSPERFSGAAGRRRSPNAGRPDSTPVGCFFCFYQIVFKNC